MAHTVNHPSQARTLGSSARQGRNITGPLPRNQSQMIRLPPAGRPRCTLAMSPPSLADFLLPPTTRRRLESVVEVHPTVLTEFTSESAHAALAETDVILAGWGSPKLDDQALSRAPKLSALVCATGSAAPLVTATGTERLRATNAGLINAVPVAEYTIAMILIAGKQILPAARLYRSRRRFLDREATFPIAGNYRRRVGIIGASRIGRLVISGLQRLADLHIIVSDPYLTAAEADALGVQLASLPELMRTCDVVSVHAPHIASTVGMITADLLAQLPAGGTLINTARGELIDQDALLMQLVSGRINAILDVTAPDVLAPGHPFYDLENVLLTPHMAGSVGNELARMGAHVVDEITRFTLGEAFLHEETLAPALAQR